jgi:hypothetical protein
MSLASKFVTYQGSPDRSSSTRMEGRGKRCVTRFVPEGGQSGQPMSGRTAGCTPEFPSKRAKGHRHLHVECRGRTGHHV